VSESPTVVVLDTNIVLDIYLFRDPRVVGVHDALMAGQMRWTATQRMRDELARVLAYAHIDRWMSHHDRHAQQVLDAVDPMWTLSPDAPSAPASLRCRDKDDQMFIDLALSHRCLLLSKDREVLRLKRPLHAHGVTVCDKLT
jgi:putative PIN family toxin of toxin-antitoxin system